MILAINYIADIKCLDLCGLASLEVVNQKITNQYTTNSILEIAKKNNVKIAIVYDHWFEIYGGIPLQWKLAGQWKILNNKICGGDVVSFYAVDSGEYENLLKNLSLFSCQLPADVIHHP